MLETLNSIAGLAAIAVTALLAFIQVQIKTQVSQLRQEILTRDATMMATVASQFIRKPDLQDDWPVPRREYAAHVADDLRQHETIGDVMQSYHRRFLNLDIQMAKLSVSDGKHSGRVPPMD